MPELHAPSDLECLRFEIELQARIHLFVTLETARRAICAYSADPCDCKYGVTKRSPGSEATGCCELRDFIGTVTGWHPYHIYGLTPESVAEGFAQQERDTWLADYSDAVEDFFNACATESS